MKLVLITSALNPVKKPLSYINTRSIYSVEERFQQLLDTIKSVKNKIPDYYIVLVDASKHIEEYENILTKLVDKYYNFKENDIIMNKVESPFKGLGEVYTMLGYLTSNDLSDFDCLIKISGRYHLNNNFNYEIFDNKLNIFRQFNNHIVSTRLYKIDKHYFDKFIVILKNAMSLLEKGKSIEEILYSHVQFSNTTILGLSGNIAVTGDYINE
jgi:hypothetical protein